MKLTQSFLGVYHPMHKLALLLGDLACIAVSFYIATNYRLNSAPDYPSIEYIGLNIVLVLSFFVRGAYTSSTLDSKPKLPLKAFFTVLAAIIPCTLFIYLLGPESFTALFGRGVFPVAIFILGFFSVFSRYLINSAFRTDNIRQNILILGDSSAQDRIDHILSMPLKSVNVHHSEKLHSYEDSDIKLDAIIVSPEYKLEDNEQETLINCRLAGVPIFSLSDFFERFLFLVPVQEINNDWFIRTQGFAMLHSSVATRVKRFTDIFVALLLVILTFPITIITAFIIKLTSSGPVFFSQDRVGIKGQIFTIYKFRTMHAEAEKDGAKWASQNDPRILPIGKTLRKLRIDELPQCWNILKGDMSIIGPRPERPEFTSVLAREIPYYDLRHVVKPGLTGWAQVKYPYGASIDDALRKLQFDLYYIKNQSPILDLNIILRTLTTVFERAGR